MKWVDDKKCKTNMKIDNESKAVFKTIERAEKRLEDNKYDNKVLKWNTKEWGEIPADFGRK
jgi:ribonuclease HI